MVGPGKQNPEKLEKIYRELPKLTDDITAKSQSIRRLLTELLGDYQKVDKLLDETELVNARGIKDAADNMHKSYNNLLMNKDLDAIPQLLVNCSDDLQALNDYYVKRYKKTVERLNQ